MKYLKHFSKTPLIDYFGLYFLLELNSTDIAPWHCLVEKKFVNIDLLHRMSIKGAEFFSYPSGTQIFLPPIPRSQYDEHLLKVNWSIMDDKRNPSVFRNSYIKAARAKDSKEFDFLFPCSGSLSSTLFFCVSQKSSSYYFSEL